MITGSLQQLMPQLISGNCGLVADVMYIFGGFFGRFLQGRSALNMICINATVSELKVWANDYDYDFVITRQE